MASNPNWAAQFVDLFTPAPDSTADVLISSVFGTWIYGDPSSITQAALIFGAPVATPLSYIIGFSGLLATVLATIMMTYSYLGELMNGAWKGEIGNNKVDALFWPVRAVFAFTLIMPVTTVAPGVDIALSQVWAIDLSRAGSAVADNVAITYAQSTLSALSVPITPVSPSFTDSIPDAVWEMTSCAMARGFYKAWDEKSQSVSFAQIHSSEIQQAGVGAATAAAPELLNFTAGGNANIDLVRDSVKTWATNDIFATRTPRTKRVTFGPGGECGSISFRTDSSLTPASDPIEAYLRATSSEFYTPGTPLAELISSFATIAHGLAEIGAEHVETMIGDSNIADAKAAPLMEAYAAASQRFYKQTGVVLGTGLASSAGEISTAMFQDLLSGGWAELGRYYNTIPRITGMTSEVYKSLESTVSAGSYSYNCGVTWTDWDGDDCDTMKMVGTIAPEFPGLVRIWRTQYGTGNPSGTHGISSCKKSNCDPDKIDNDWTVWVAGAILTGLDNTGSQLTGTGATSGVFQDGAAGPHPVATLSSIGVALTNLNYLVSAGITAARIAKGAAEGAANTPLVGGVPGAVAGALEAFLVLADKIWATLVGTAFMLGYVLPKLPYIIWVMMVCGWVVTVIEAVFAFPFAIAMLAQTSSEGMITTRFEKALSLISAVLLRPFLCVAGFAASHAVAIPFFAFFNHLYWGGLNNTLQGHNVTGLFDVMANLVLYTVFATILVKMIYSIMHLLGDQILNWVTGGIASVFGPQGAGDEVLSVSNRFEGLERQSGKRSQIFGTGSKKAAEK